VTVEAHDIENWFCFCHQMKTWIHFLSSESRNWLFLSKVESRDQFHICYQLKAETGSVFVIS